MSVLDDLGAPDDGPRRGASVKVNLLPREVGEAVAERRILVGSGAGVVVVVLLLALLYALQLASVANTRSERDEEQAEVARLEARVVELEPFRRLAQELDARNALLASAMATEISWATVLNDVSLTFPPNASLTQLSASALLEDPEAGVIAFGPSVGSVIFSGYSVERYAPGVEATLLQFDRVRAFFNVYLNMAARELIGATEVTGFDGSSQLDETAYTHRYAEGLPEGAQ